MDCPRCQSKTGHKHMHRTAHGIEETHMNGSEHYECKECSYIMFKVEAEAQDLKFVLD